MLAPRALNTTKNPINFCSTYLSPVPYLYFNIFPKFKCYFQNTELKGLPAVKKLNRQPWLDERRDLFAKNVFRDFTRSSLFFMHIEQKYRETQVINYEDLDNLVGTQTDRGILWILKDNCHHLWKDIDPKNQPEPFFFDWIIGAIFHEAMKLKENVYLIERYQPVYRLATSAMNLSSRQKKYRQFFEQILEDIHRGMKRLKDLFIYAIKQMQALLLTERDNSLLVRSILENRSELEKLWQKNGGIDGMLGTLFPEGLYKAYSIAGKNYLEGSWYTKAQAAFEEALRLNPDCQEAEAGLETLKKRQKDWKERDGWGTRIRT